MMKEKTPLNKLAEPIDIAYAYLYLAYDEARYVNGAVLSGENIYEINKIVVS